VPEKALFDRLRLTNRLRAESSLGNVPLGGGGKGAEGDHVCR